MSLAWAGFFSAESFPVFLSPLSDVWAIAGGSFGSSGFGLENLPVAIAQTNTITPNVVPPPMRHKSMMVSFFCSSFFSPFIPDLTLRRETSIGVVSILRLSTFNCTWCL